MTTAKYQTWIDRWRGSNDPVGACVQATNAMVAEFPERTRVRRHVFGPRCPVTGWPHWWCETDDGDLVDPSASQFPAIFDYVAIDESAPEPTGKCMECGDYCYDTSGACSPACLASLNTYYNGIIADAGMLSPLNTKEIPDG